MKWRIRGLGVVFGAEGEAKEVVRRGFRWVWRRSVGTEERYYGAVGEAGALAEGSGFWTEGQ
jgi:hypothetical protein